MLETVFKSSESDVRLAGLIEEAREYAQIYLLAKKRHKGCEGTGEFVTLREEFKDAIDKMVIYCIGKKYLSGDCPSDIDSWADILIRMNTA